LQRSVGLLDDISYEVTINDAMMKYIGDVKDTPNHSYYFTPLFCVQLSSNIDEIRNRTLDGKSHAGLPAILHSLPLLHDHDEADSAAVLHRMDGCCCGGDVIPRTARPGKGCESVSKGPLGVFFAL
jgi:hypothetical protein